MLFCIFMQRGGNDLQSLDDKEEGTKLIFFPSISETLSSWPEKDFSALQRHFHFVQL